MYIHTFFSFNSLVWGAQVRPDNVIKCHIDTILKQQSSISYPSTDSVGQPPLIETSTLHS